MRRSVIGVALGLTLLVPGCASQFERNNARYRSELPGVLRALESQGDADSLAAAALLNFERGPALDWVQRAVALAPARPDIAWLALAMCAAEPSCDTQPLERDFRKLDPGNGAVWLISARRSNDEESLARSLQGLAESERVYTFWIPLRSNLLSPLVRTGRWTQGRADEALVGMLAARSIPAYFPMVRPCKAEKLDAQTLQTCRALTKTLLNADTYITENLGLQMTTRLWPADSAETLDALKAIRANRYQMAMAQEKLDSQGGSFEGESVYLDSFTTEQEYTCATVASFGKSIDPPADWVDPWQ